MESDDDVPLAVRAGVGKGKAVCRVLMKIEQTILAKAINSSNRKARPTAVWTRQLAMPRTAKCTPRLCTHPT